MVDSSKRWLANPGNVITLILAVLSIGSAIYNAAASMSVEMVQVRMVTETNAEQIRELAAKLDQTITVVNKHVQWSEGRSANLAELERRVERLEALADRQRP